MEEGSLVQEALQRMQEQRDHGGLLENTLVVDVFVLSTANVAETLNPRISLLQQLAHLAQILNGWIQQLKWNWHVGGEGMAFGVHVSNKIPHLRATCRYQENVEDEWFAIAAMMIFTSLHNNVVAECWDLDDGQVILIESAAVLPSWVDEVGPQACRHACWIQGGRVKLINNPIIQQREALQILGDSNIGSPVVMSPPEVQNAIENRIQNFLAFLVKPPPAQSNNIPPELKNYLHRAPFVVPQKLAVLMKQRPDLVHCAIQAYCQSCFQDNNLTLGKHIAFQDLAWTTCVLSRTSFAMLRTVESERFSRIPNEYKSVEANRMKRACQVQSTPHLRYALQNGLRITAGFEYILSQQGKANGAPAFSSEERIVQHWSLIDRECGGDGQWLLESWQAGPNRAVHDLGNLMKCPVYKTEVDKFVSPLSHPGVSLRDQVKSQLKRECGSVECVPPRPEDVDDDAWLELQSIEEMDEITTVKVANDAKPASEPASNTASHNTDSIPSQSQAELHPDEEMSQTKSLDTMLESFQSFVTSEKSDIQGVSHNVDNMDTETLDPVQINPRVFMNLLHTALKSSPEELPSIMNSNDQDPYFSKEDYDMMEEGVSSSDDNESEGGDGAEEVESMQAVMRAMDDELRGTKASLVMDQVQDDQVRAGEVDEEVAFNTHVLSNLLESLDSGGGGPGPVQNMLTEMGVKPPDAPK